MSTRRIIEEQMPLTAISRHSAREKSIRHGHLSTLHIWWARRPLAACRAAIFAALVPHAPTPAAAQQQQAFLAELANWDNSLDGLPGLDGHATRTFVARAREQIRAAFPAAPPRVLDPFAGGGAIPLEALRLGCETYALDLNPVAHIIQLATLVYPQQYGSQLAADVRHWGAWVLERARAELGALYASPTPATTTVAYLWARTIPCPNPHCAIPVPLIRQTWLSRKPKKYVAYRIVATGPGQPLRYAVVGPVDKPAELGFDPTAGTTRRGVATCPACGSPLTEKHIKAESMAGRLGSELVAVVVAATDRSGKHYRSVSDADRATFQQAQQQLARVQAAYDPYAGDLPPLPDEKLVDNDMKNVWCVIYGLDTYGKLFNERQGLALITFARLVREAHAAMLAAGMPPAYATAVATYLGIALDRLADYNSVLTRWLPTLQTPAGTFGRQALPMTWDYTEINVSGDVAGSWQSALDWITRYIEHGAATASTPATVQRGSATAMPYPDQFFDAVITDPPYYNNIAYAELSDFFYVWLRRSIGHLHPSVLGTPITPKEQQITEGGTLKRSKAWFEAELAAAFKECTRVLKDDGICVVVYAHKAISAWETLVAALLRAGLLVEGSWPFSTEMANRLRGRDSAALASSIFLVCRKRHSTAGGGRATSVREEIRHNVHTRLNDFWQQGLRGADFFISAIGPATAAFSRYDEVRTLSGELVTVSTLLEWVQEAVADYALQRVFAAADAPSDGSTGIGSVDDQTRFYVLWRWTYDGQASVVGTTGSNGEAEASEPDAPDAPDSDSSDSSDGDKSGDSDKSGKSGAKIPFGDAHLMATALGADVNALINHAHLLEGSSTVRLLGASERAERRPDLGDARADGSRPPLIDMLHRCELLWVASDQAALNDYLNEFSPADVESLRRIAQALIDLLPRGDQEKQRLEGFLYGLRSHQPGAAPPPPPVQHGLSLIHISEPTRH